MFSLDPKQKFRAPPPHPTKEFSKRITDIDHELRPSYNYIKFHVYHHGQNQWRLQDASDMWKTYQVRRYNVNTKVN